MGTSVDVNVYDYNELVKELMDNENQPAAYS